MVSARSERIGPKLWLVLINVPVVASNRYVKPDAGDGSGRLVSWRASATLNCVKFDWNALLKCAECVDPSGSTASLSTTRPLGPNRSWNTSDSVGTGRDCAAADDARANSHTMNVRTRRPMDPPMLLPGRLMANRFDDPVRARLAQRQGSD